MKGTLEFDASQLADIPSAMRNEWMEANGLGGWASGTVVGPATRRYHGLLVAALHPPVHRVMLLARLDETLQSGGRATPLTAIAYEDGIRPAAWQPPVRFRRDLFPGFEFAVGGVRLRKTIGAIHDENTTVILYELLEAPGPVRLDLRPRVAGRDCHWLVRGGKEPRAPAAWRGETLALPSDPALPDCCLYLPGATYAADPEWIRDIHLAVEAFRGSDHLEDLYSHGVIHRDLAPGQSFGVVVSLDPNERRDAVRLLELERARREAQLARLPVRDEFTEPLALAADQLIVRRGADLRTILAGYHWFTDWGRDTMIALPGLCLCTGRADDAKRILKAFAGYVDQGMLPNCFPDADAAPHYNTIDGTLWYFVAIHKYFEATGDTDFVLNEMLPVLLDIIDWHVRGTRYGIKVDDDGLLAGGGPDTQLTWMDVKVDGWVVTPRHGKAVEINALWYNALRITEGLCRRAGKTERADRCKALGEQVRCGFEPMFWNETGGSLYDVVNEKGKDPAIRPNQIFAVSLPFPLLEGPRAAKVVEVVERELLTPKGLRSLAPGHPDYKGDYGGPILRRDGAYHQGTVWSWPLGHFITALVRVRGDAGRQQAAEILRTARIRHFAEAGVGTVSEIFDGNAPHAPRGCISQAWGVAEYLRAYLEDVHGANAAR